MSSSGLDVMKWEKKEFQKKNFKNGTHNWFQTSVFHVELIHENLHINIFEFTNKKAVCTWFIVSLMLHLQKKIEKGLELVVCIIF